MFLIFLILKRQKNLSVKNIRKHFIKLLLNKILIFNNVDLYVLELLAIFPKYYNFLKLSVVCLGMLPCLFLLRWLWIHVRTPCTHWLCTGSKIKKIVTIISQKQKNIKNKAAIRKANALGISPKFGLLYICWALERNNLK